MDLDTIWNDFSERMAEIELYYRAAKDIAKKEQQKIAEYLEYLNKNPQLKDVSSSLHNMSFYDAITGEIRFYNFKELNPKNRYLHVLLHKNKQYQWLLAEAYEEFEDFLEKIYAYKGYKDNDFWPLKDYGNIFISDIKTKDFKWFLERAKQKKDIPHSILNHFRKRYPIIAKVENDNKLRVNLRLAVILIENLRHIIVHKNGIVSNKQDFVINTLKKSGLYNNGKYDEKNYHLITSFFGDKEYENLITLLEIRVHPEIPLDIHVSLFNNLTGYLLAYAYLIYECVNNENGTI